RIRSRRSFRYSARRRGLCASCSAMLAMYAPSERIDGEIRAQAGLVEQRVRSEVEAQVDGHATHGSQPAQAESDRVAQHQRLEELVGRRRPQVSSVVEQGELQGRRHPQAE